MHDERNNDTATARTDRHSRRRSRARANAALVIEQGGLVSAAVPPPGPTEAARAARVEVLERLAVEVRTLVTIARSAALPPARRLDEMERTVARHLDSLRADAIGG